MFPRLWATAGFFSWKLTKDFSIETNQKQMQSRTFQDTPHLRTHRKLLPVKARLPEDADASWFWGRPRHPAPRPGAHSQDAQWEMKAFCFPSSCSPSWPMLSARGPTRRPGQLLWHPGCAVPREGNSSLCARWGWDRFFWKCAERNLQDWGQGAVLVLFLFPSLYKKQNNFWN